MSADQQPEPCCFVAPVDLDGDPTPSFLTERACVLVVAFLVGIILAITLYGCAPRSAYRPPTTYRACSAACERIGCSRAEVETACGAFRRFPV